jgi:hypothetical protein
MVARMAAVIDWPKRARMSIMARSAKRSCREAADTTAVDLTRTRSELRSTTTEASQRNRTTTDNDD